MCERYPTLSDFRIYLSEHFFRFHDAILSAMIARKAANSSAAKAELKHFKG
jgi:hypothetical protein